MCLHGTMRVQCGLTSAPYAHVGLLEGAPQSSMHPMWARMPTVHPHGAMQARMAIMLNCGTPSWCGTRADGAPGHFGVPSACNAAEHGSCGHQRVDSQGATQTHIGHPVSGLAPRAWQAHAHGAPTHLRCTLRVPCRHTRGSWSPWVHLEGGMQVQMGHLVTCGTTLGEKGPLVTYVAPLRGHEGTHGASRHLP